VAQLHPGAIVIGSDQVPELDGQPLSKPGTHERATEQLRQMSGRQMNFHTGVCVSCAETGFTQSSVVTVQVRFRELNDLEIERYLRAEQPYDCAGSAKSEGLGIALLDAIVSDDPTALIGLPLIRTCQLLRCRSGAAMSETSQSKAGTFIWCPLHSISAAKARQR
jgi:septum formation protein